MVTAICTGSWLGPWARISSGSSAASSSVRRSRSPPRKASTSRGIADRPIVDKRTSAPRDRPFLGWQACSAGPEAPDDVVPPADAFVVLAHHLDHPAPNVGMVELAPPNRDQALEIDHVLPAKK